MKTVGIIILNWQQADLTAQTIESLANTNHKNFKYKIYLIDNGSTDNSVEKLQKLLPVVSLPQNLGFSEGNNQGIKLAQKDGCDYILLLNNDVLVDPDFLVKMLEPFSQDKKIGMVGPKIYFAPGYEFHKSRYTKNQIGRVIWAAGGEIDWNNVYGKNTGIDDVDTGQYDTYRDNLEFVSNCCILFKTTCLKNTGLMPPEYFLYCEDMDFCQKFIYAGYKIAYTPSAKIWHINSGSTKPGGGGSHDYFLTRNRLIFGFKYTQIRTKFALVRESVRLLFIGTPWQKRGVIDFYLGIRGRGSWQK